MGVPLGQFGLAKIGGEARCGPSSKHAYLAHRAHAVTERKWGGGKFSAGGSLAMGAGKAAHDPAAQTRARACRGWTRPGGRDGTPVKPSRTAAACKCTLWESRSPGTA